MVSTVHVAVAAAVVRVVPGPWSIPLAFVSHFALDTVPHWNWRPGGNRVRLAASLADTFVAVVLSLFFAVRSVHPSIMLLACVAAIVPDLVQGPYYFLAYQPKWLSAFIGWESRRQKWGWMRQWMGIATQVVTFVVAMVVWMVRS